MRRQRRRCGRSIRLTCLACRRWDLDLDSAFGDICWDLLEHKRAPKTVEQRIWEIKLWKSSNMILVIALASLTKDNGVTLRSEYLMRLPPKRRELRPNERRIES